MMGRLNDGGDGIEDAITTSASANAPISSPFDYCNAVLAGGIYNLPTSPQRYSN